MNDLTLPRSLLDSRVWRRLRPPARAVYIEIALEYDGKNNGAIRLSHREAAFLTRMSLGAMIRAFKELVAAGLIRNTARGERFAAQWFLAHLPSDADGVAQKLREAARLAKSAPATASEADIARKPLLVLEHEVNHDPA